MADQTPPSQNPPLEPPVYAVGVESVLEKDPKIIFESVFSLKHSGRVQDLIMHSVQEMLKDKFSLLEAPMRHCLEISVLALWMHYRKGESSKCLEIEVGFDGKFLAGMVSGFVPREYGDLKKAAGQAASLSAFLQTLTEQTQKLTVRHNLSLGHIQILFRFDLSAVASQDVAATDFDYLTFETPQDAAAQVHEVQNILEKEPLGEGKRLLSFQAEERAEDIARAQVRERFDAGEGTPLEERLKEETAELQGSEYTSPYEPIEVVPGGEVEADGQTEVKGSREAPLGGVQVKGKRDAALGKVKVAGTHKANEKNSTQVKGSPEQISDEETIVGGGEDGVDEEITKLSGGGIGADDSQTKLKGSKQGERKTVLKGGVGAKSKNGNTVVGSGTAEEEDETLVLEGSSEEELEVLDGVQVRGTAGKSGVAKNQTKTVLKGKPGQKTKDQVTVLSGGSADDDDDHVITVLSSEEESEESAGGVLNTLIRKTPGKAQGKPLGTKIVKKPTAGATTAEATLDEEAELEDDPSLEILEGELEAPSVRAVAVKPKKPKLSSKQLIDRIKKGKPKLTAQDQELVSILEEMQNSGSDLEEDGSDEISANPTAKKKSGAQDVLQGIQELLEVEEIEQAAKTNDGQSTSPTVTAETLAAVAKKTEEDLKAVQENTDHFATDLDVASQGFTQVVEKAKTVLERVPVPEKLKEYLQKMFEELSKNRAELEHKTREIVGKWKKAQLDFKVSQTMLNTEIQKKDGLLRQKEANIDKSKQALASTMRALENAREQLRTAGQKENDTRDARMKVLMEKNQVEMARITQRMDLLKQRLNTEAAQRSGLANENAQLNRKILAFQDQLKGSDKWKVAASQEPQLRSELERTQRQIEDLKKQNKMLQDKLTQAAALKAAAGNPSKAKEANHGEASGGELKLKLEQQTKLYQKMKDDFDRAAKRLEESKQAETKMRIELSKLQMELKNVQKANAKPK